jgi:type I restriction enzyme S subunit
LFSINLFLDGEVGRVDDLVDHCADALAHLGGREWMRTETRGAALPGVNVGDFRRMPIPLPPLTEQQEIVRRVEGLFALADQLEQRLATARGQVDKLPPSLLARAFAGQLVPQNPTDEPAKKLLERIKTNHESKSR